MSPVIRHTTAPAVGGTLSVALGALALLASGGQSHYLAFGAALCLGGALLVWAGVTARPIGRIGWLATGMLGLAGLFLSLLVSREDVCCMFGYHRGLGYPWGWLDSDATADSMAAIEAMKSSPEGLEQTVDWPKVVFDGLFWWHAALIVVVPITRVRRAARGPSQARE
ncbi:hypothetical protein GCM10022226_08380 [Sphaerisporangium flaviroseum]|uniref:Disulfide bond formation protein B n=1 Tax=Sphaerisporangium flaviroseum TaxID=509199 RepID=A0ABP7HH50_9ACTN